MSHFNATFRILKFIKLKHCLIKEETMPCQQDLKAALTYSATFRSKENVFLQKLTEKMLSIIHIKNKNWHKATSWLIEIRQARNKSGCQQCNQDSSAQDSTKSDNAGLRFGSASHIHLSTHFFFQCNIPGQVSPVSSEGSFSFFYINSAFLILDSL